MPSFFAFFVFACRIIASNSRGECNASGREVGEFFLLALTRLVPGRAWWLRAEEEGTAPRQRRLKEQVIAFLFKDGASKRYSTWTSEACGGWRLLGVSR
jgi:hypothetical protein